MVSKINIRIDNSDGTFTEYSNVLSQQVANKLLSDVISWQDNWGADVNTVKKYLEAEAKFIQSLKESK